MARVLLIDDEEYVRMTLGQALEDEGHAVLMATNGREGLEVFAAERPDLVITDLLMPDKEGIETIRELRRIVPDVKIVVISGGGRVNNVDFLEVARKFGAAAALRKPFPLDEFCKVVSDCLGPLAAGPTLSVVRS